MYRILLVDDEILVRDAIKENIDWKGMDCELVGDCENGKEAAEFVKRTSGGYCVDRYIDAIHGRNGTEQFSA
ncbi:MAG: hypothetical protein ACLTTJ_11525 [Blautia sp.]